MDLDENDWIQANIISTNNTDPKYEYILLEKNKLPMTSNYLRREERMLPVFKHQDLSRYCVYTVNQEETKIQILLSDQDVRNFRIDESSIIDYAYLEGRMTGGRVIWKYSVYDLKENKSLPTNEKRTKTVKVTEQINSPIRPVKQIFDGKFIAMIGGGNLNLQKEIKDEIERRGGTFIFCSGDESQTTIRSRLKRSDAVVVFTQSISHEAMHLTKTTCKNNKTPITYTKNMGADTFVKSIVTLLK